MSEFAVFSTLDQSPRKRAAMDTYLGYAVWAMNMSYRRLESYNFRQLKKAVQKHGYYPTWNDYCPEAFQRGNSLDWVVKGRKDYYRNLYSGPVIYDGSNRSPDLPGPNDIIMDNGDKIILGSQLKTTMEKVEENKGQSANVLFNHKSILLRHPDYDIPDEQNP